MSKKLISVHFPKAGGSSLRDELSSLLGTSLLLDYEHSPRGEQALDVVSALPAGILAVHGHFRPSRYAQIPDSYLFTFLRDPVDAMISRYFYWRGPRYLWRDWLRLGKAPGGEDPSKAAQQDKFAPDGEWSDVLQFARNSGTRFLMSQLYFGGFDMERFHFIGFYDTREADLPRLASGIGLPLSPNRHSNRSRHSRLERFMLVRSPKVLSQLRDILIDDLRFYERVRARWS